MMRQIFLPLFVRRAQVPDSVQIKHHINPRAGFCEVAEYGMALAIWPVCQM